jgi:hypothetical protein
MPVATSLAMTSATTKVYLAVGQTPATYDAAGFAALSWQILPDITNIGQLGGTTTVVNHIPVDTAAVVKRAGSVNYGTLQLTGARSTSSALDGVRTAFTSRLSTPCKIVYPAALGQTDYFTGIVTTNQTNVGTADQILGFNFTFDIDNSIITV